MARPKTTADDGPTAASETDFGAALDFVAFASKAMPLTALLDGVPDRAARLLSSKVVSIYLLEGHGDGLVLRGNVGFTPSAQGTIRLRVGEGMTGLAVQRREPIAAVRASNHDAFRRFTELDEDRYPVFLAVPIVGPDRRPLGALVAQRETVGFTTEEIVLATTLTAPIAHAVRQAALLDDLRDRPARKTGGGTRRVTLPGRPIVAGRALGAIAAVRRPAKDRKIPPQSDEVPRILASFEAVERSIRGFEARAAAQNLVGPTSFFTHYALMASDERLRERAVELVKDGCGAAEALSTVAREVTRAATGAVGHPFLAERSRDIEDLCDAVLMLAAPDARAETPTKAVLLSEQLSMFDLLVTARAQPCAVALTSPASARSETIMRLMGVPSIAEVEGAFRWVAPGDVAILDGDHGFLILNPSRAEVSTLRALRKRRGEPVEASDDAI